jgi:hypothetical protein
MISGGDHRDGGEACKLESVKKRRCGPIGRDGVSTADCEDAHMCTAAYALSTVSPAGWLVRVSNEDASVGLLVVQGRRFRPIPGKIPQAAAPLTGPSQGGVRLLFCFPQPAFGEISTGERRSSRSLAHDA